VRGEDNAVVAPRTRTLLLVAQPIEAGVPHHVRDLIPAALADGWRVEVACPPVSVLWSAAGAHPEVARHPISAARAPSPSDARSLARLVPLVRRADVVHAHSAKAGLLARVAARLTGRTDRCVFTPHGWSFWAYPAFLPVERLAARWATAIVAVSAHERDAGLDAGVGRRDQFAVIPNGIDLQRFSPGPPTGDHDHLVMIGRLAAQRRHEVLLEAVARLRADGRRPDLTLELVGDGPRRAELEAMTAARGIAGAVTFAGDRPAAEVPARLRTAACVVHATHYEGASLGVLEAMACGRAVVASAIGGMDELVVPGRTGELCAGGDAAAWADAIDRVLTGDRRQTMGAAARQRAEQRFSLDAMRGRTLALYQRILTERSEAAQLPDDLGR
jgi:glycosyltransferase involved in cell wall biosynthesis